ncbi:UEV-domain-containing protein [Pleomassaria siparia CBS 279.74]|uniref:UEV-domain-containing protein n=1 Tax=Pleomassaria siparia CBS 279.74 TaxID=1314801 RepID=A0A6G1KC56_9PLEO|nr:UEV-domain-containing protein [Pleomassaria siparia CBS 279.74]
MAGVPEKVLNWLYSVLPSEYAEVNRTYHDAVETLSNYPSLSPRTEVYTYENGASALLLLLSGTLPVSFRGATYGFPVAIWVPHAYPRESPIVYVTPSQDMLVRPGQHVSGDGRVYHPYLAQWAKYWDKSTIFDFLAVLRAVFAKEPPVRSRQQQHNGPTPQAPQAPPPVPPPPAEWRRSNAGAPTASLSPGPASHAPAPPPKPPKPYEQSRPSSQAEQSRYQQPPPLPPHPPQQHQQLPQYQQQRNTYGGQSNWQQQQLSQGQGQGPPSQHDPSRQVSYDMSPATPPTRPQVQGQGAQGYQSNSYEVGSPVSPISPETQARGSRYQQPAPPPQQPNFSRPHPQQQQYGQPPPGQPPYEQQQHPLQNYQPQQYHQQYRQQPPPQQAPPPPKPQPPINLLDDSLEVTIPSQTGTQVPLPVPPVPPNPEKDALLRALSQAFCSQIRQTVSSNQSAITPLLAQQSALQTAYTHLQTELEQIQQLDAALASNENILRDTMREADRVMNDARQREVPDVDDVLVAPTVVGGQLYSLAAEERGIADALFVLGRGLDRGRVGADVFIKQTRSLAREQFLKKALIKKIAKGMALDEFQMR